MIYLLYMILYLWPFAFLVNALLEMEWPNRMQVGFRVGRHLAALLL